MKGLPRSLGRVGAASSLRTLTIAVNALALSVADGAPGFGSAVISGLPQGNILFLGAVAYLKFTSADADITTTYEGDFSLGTTATADNTLSGTDADIVPSTALGPATAKVTPQHRGVSTDALGGGILDNTDGSLELNLNVIIDDAAISGAVSMTVDGLVHMAFIMLGDD